MKGMSKLAWVFLGLLLATNAFWLLSGRDEADEADDGGGTMLDMEQTIADLQAEVAQLRRAEPVLLGTEEGAGHPSSAVASDAEVETGQGASAEDEEAEQARAAAEADEVRRKAQTAALAKAKEILGKIMQVEDAGLRAEGLRELTAALEGDDPYLVEYALSSLHSLRKTELDRSEFLSSVRQHLDSENGGIRRAALYALHSVDPASADPRLAVQSASDPSPIVRQHSARLISMYGGGTIEGDASDAIVKLLSDENANVRRGTLRGVSNAKVTPEIEARLIEMAEVSNARQEVVYHGLSMLRDKSRTVVDALVAHLDDDNAVVRRRAHWGLQRNVAQDQQLHVATQYASRLGRFVTPSSQNEALRLIARYGNGGLAPQLERFAENEMVGEKTREMARKAAEYLRRKESQR